MRDILRGSSLSSTQELVTTSLSVCVCVCVCVHVRAENFQVVP